MRGFILCNYKPRKQLLRVPADDILGFGRSSTDQICYGIQMLASILIILFSTALLVYWFRYTCILLVRNAAEEVGVAQPPTQGHFHFGEVQNRLRSEDELDPLHSALQRDYQVLTYFTRHASGLQLASFEERLLVWDYQLMQFWYSVTKTAAPDQAREALAEMASVLGILAGRVGERAGVRSEA